MDKFNSSGDPVVGIISGTIPPSSLTFTNTDRLAGRDTSPGGAGEEITVGGGVEFTGSGGIQRSALTGDVTASAGSGTTAIATDAVTTAKILDANVTLAKMADLAQDQFIGRTTASTGVPQTATITAAARTVLDDTTVAAMVDTLGGASSTGTGGLVRATSPTLVTPVLGVASATTLTLTNDLAIADGGTGQSTQTAAMDALSPTTTKGDILIDNGTNVIRFGVGNQGTAFVADPEATNGALWTPPAFVPYGRRVCQYLPDPGLATASSVGMIAPTTEGTLATAPTNAAGAALQFTGGTTAGDSCGWYTAFGVTQGRWFYDIEWVWRSPVYLDRRFWCGVFSADPKAITSPTGIDCVGLRYDYGVDTGGFFRAVTSDVSGTPTVVILDGTSGNGTMNAALNVTIRFRLRINAAGSAEFYSDGVLMTTISTTLPQTSDPLGLALRHTTLNSVAAVLRHFRMSWAQNP